MRILWYAKQFNTPMSGWVLVHIRDELKCHGIEIDFFNILAYQNPQEANAEFIKHLECGQYDIFITDYNEHDLFIETLEEVKERGIPTVLFCCDNLVVPYRHLKIAPYFDLVWLTSSETEWMFKEKGCHTIFLPYAANPNLTRYSGAEVVGVGFAGTPYGSRANMINSLIKNDIDIYCYCKKDESETFTEHETQDNEILYKSPYVERRSYVFRKMLGYKEGRKIIEGFIANKLKSTSRIDENSKFFHKKYMVAPKYVYQLYGRHSLSLSSTTARNTGVLKKPLYIANLRSFEIPMAGGIQFCRYSPELAGYFEADKEIVFFEDNDEMVERARFYLDDRCSELRKQMKINARKRAENEHTWYHRFKKIFDELGVRENAVI